MTPSQDILLVALSAVASFTLLITGAGIMTRTTKEYRAARTVVKAVITTYGERLARQEETCRSISTELGRLRGSIEKLETCENNPSQIERQTTIAATELTQALKEASVNIRLFNENLRVQEERPLGPALTARSRVSGLDLVSKRGSDEMTATEIYTLRILATEGAKTSTELHERVGRSREHFARLMKKLYERGYVDRDTSKIPFTYRIIEAIPHKVLEATDRAVDGSA